MPSDFAGDALATATALQDHLANAVDDQETANRSIAASNSLVNALERDANQVRFPGGERGDRLVGLSLTIHWFLTAFCGPGCTAQCCRRLCMREYLISASYVILQYS